MTIYGVGLLAICFLAGQLTGELLGNLLGIEANVGGVGFAMLMLMLVNGWLERRGMMEEPTRRGIAFWDNLYIPVIVAMSATQNVRVALDSGTLALLAGSIPVALLFFLVPVIRRKFIDNSGNHA